MTRADVDVVAAGEELQGLFDPPRRIAQAFAIGILAELCQQAPDEFPASWHSTCCLRLIARRAAQDAATPTRCIAQREDPDQARSRRPTSGPARAAIRPELRGRLEARAGAATGSARRDPRSERRAALETGVKAGEAAITLDPAQARRPLLAGREHGRAGRVVRPAPGLKYRGKIKEALETVLKIDRGLAARLGRPRARPLVLQGARAVRRQQGEVRDAPAQVADLQPEQHRHALLPWRRRCSSAGRRPRRAPSCSSARRPDRPRLDARRPGFKQKAARNRLKSLTVNAQYL